MPEFRLRRLTKLVWLLAILGLAGPIRGDLAANDTVFNGAYAGDPIFTPYELEQQIREYRALGLDDEFLGIRHFRTKNGYHVYLIYSHLVDKAEPTILFDGGGPSTWGSGEPAGSTGEALRDLTGLGGSGISSLASTPDQGEPLVAPEWIPVPEASSAALLAASGLLLLWRRRGKRAKGASDGGV